jgi:hypothetical protein
MVGQGTRQLYTVSFRATRQAPNACAPANRRTVLGCRIALEAPAAPQSISVAEAVLGTIEAFFATSLNEKIAPYRSEAKIIVEPQPDLTEGLLVTNENIDGKAFMRVRHPALIPTFTPGARQRYRDGLMDLIAHFMSHVAIIEDVASYMERVAGEERGFARALIYSEVSLAQDNLFGSSPKVLLSDWAPREGARRLPLLRTNEWTEGLSIKQIPLPEEDEPQLPKTGQYLLAPAHFISETEIPDVGLDSAILKGQLIVKNAWEISLNNLDAPALICEDDPLIPPDVEEAPVAVLLETLRGFAKRKRV